jgi:hypothetical protein
MNAISSLHNELSQLNDAVNAATIKCTQAERIVRSKEEQFAQEQESSARKRELNTALKKYQEDEQKVTKIAATFAPSLFRRIHTLFTFDVCIIARGAALSTPRKGFYQKYGEG